MVEHIAFGPKTLPTTIMGTDERPCVFVNPHVDLEVLLLTKRLGTLGMRTLVWLSPEVQVHVRLQAATTNEPFLAIFKGTYEAFLALSPFVYL